MQHKNLQVAANKTRNIMMGRRDSASFSLLTLAKADCLFNEALLSDRTMNVFFVFFNNTVLKPSSFKLTYVPIKRNEL